PLVIVFVQLKILKLTPKMIGICLLLNIIVSVYFWIRIMDVKIALYQAIPYISSFIWLGCERILEEKAKKEDVGCKSCKGKTGDGTISCNENNK
ncbi:MAG: hypothetical protein J6C03_06570, partial [Clostridia bacterium]|nr:hypothetical protein [Clostridia bacterium]